MTMPREEEKGATAVEYGLLVALIGAAIAVTVGLLGGALDTLFSNVKTTIAGA
ncbi:Flp family type IVb pilin [Nocardioides jejuensis]|uniref:Flp family type IVb pilin n=2 Tax=Nocardioides jejuensis TaxID=2502782 RepID=A0A4R1C005_9ACTN|nr:Flp family type IVb pilin [Nocardioides jejuensis]